MSKTVLEVKNLYKSYKQYGSEFERFAGWFGINFKASHENYTLNDISFSISKGESIGIIGQNGAGKSTLLKIITGTLKATRGSCTVNGRVSAILELGMGFLPDLTGRENVYNTSALLGIGKSEVDNSILEIEEFADIGEYFDQPVRMYSSGMQVRVAFSLATSYNPDILIIDEALSVGDAYFQHKCFERIKKLRDNGTNLMFVSHDKNAVLSLCTRAILLEHGSIIKDGEPYEVFDFYNAIIAEKEDNNIAQKKNANGKLSTTSGTKRATIENIAICNIDGEQADVFEVAEKIILKIKAVAKDDLDSLVLGFAIKDRLGQSVYGTNTWHTNQTLNDIKNGEIFDFKIEFEANFGPANYSIVLALTKDSTHLSENYEWIDMAAIFHVVNTNKIIFDGICWLNPSIAIGKN